jgi:hypothetical protein
MRLFYLIAVIALALATTVDVVFNVQSGIRPDEDLISLYQLVIGLLVVAWLLTDPKLPAAQRPTLDHGFLLMVSFPVLAFYQQFVSRGWKGVASVFALTIVVLAPFLVWAIIWASA